MWPNIIYSVYYINGLYLPAEQSVLHHQLADMVAFTKNKNKMNINSKKTKIIPFNFTKKFNFLPQLNLPGADPLEVIYETKLPGVTLTSSLCWSNHIDDICKQQQESYGS